MYISLNECDCATTQKFPFGVNTKIELDSITATSHNTGTLLSHNVPCYRPLFLDVAVMFLSSIVELTPNDNFWIVPLLHSVSDMNCRLVLKQSCYRPGVAQRVPGG